MILMIGPLADSGAAQLTMLLIERGVDFVIVDPRNYTEEWDLEWWIEDGRMHGRVILNNRTIDLDEITTIWAHMVMLPDRTDEPGLSGESVHNERMAAVSAFVDCFPGRVINRPANAASNSIKPYQSKLIREHGFEPIPTLITTDPDEARAFYKECGGEMIFKSISWRRSIVRRLTEDDIERLDDVRNCPTMFQKFIPGTDIRVHVIDDIVFATEIGCNTDDYRYVPAEGERAMRGIELPVEIAEHCVSLSDALGMPVSGVDLRRSPDGRYYCFEANPIPGYMFYEQFTGQRIGDACVDFIDGPAREREKSLV